MKKLTALFLALCLCLASCVMLASCDDDTPEHTHTYKTEWATDATHHWHACEGEGCTEVADKAEHTFGEATKVKNGVYNYACTACGHVKTETVETKLTAEQFAALTLGENFIVTLHGTQPEGSIVWIEKRDGNKFSTEQAAFMPNGEKAYKYNVFFVGEEDQVYRYDVEYDDNGALISCTRSGIGIDLAYKAELVEKNFLTDEFKNASAFTYDEQTNTYVAAAITMENVTVTNVRAAFENGKIVSLSYSGTMDYEGLVYEFTFAYGTASITVPDPTPIA